MIIDGEVDHDVGVKYKGNSSYNPNGAKNPINIKENPFYFIDQVPNQEKAFNFPPMNCDCSCT